MTCLPAICGGSPVRQTFLPLARPFLGPAEKQEVMDTLESDWISRGPKTTLFEDRFAAYVGSPHAIAVSSCTAALHLALVAADISPGDEVLVPAMTFVATANVVVHQAAKPVFVDVHQDTLNVDPQRLEDRITCRTRAVIPVHFAGQPCEMDEVLALARARGLWVIEDAAHAVGAEYRGRKVGSLGPVTAFSFYASKGMTTGDGGMLTTCDEALARSLRVLSFHGMSTDAWKRYGPEGKPQWELECPGYKYNMTDLQASIGIHQLARLEGFLEARERLAALYDQAFADLPEIVPLSHRVDGRHARHLYVVLLRLDALTIDRDTFARALRAENIGTGIHFVAVHLQPYFLKTFGAEPGDCPTATWASERVLSLPLHPRMSEDDLQDVVGAVRKILTHFRR